MLTNTLTKGSKTMIDISKHDKADVLSVLYNNSRPQGLGHLHFESKDMTKEEAQEILNKDRGRWTFYFDYLKGRVMKVDLSKENFCPLLYDRDNGQGAAQRAIDTL